MPIKITPYDISQLLTLVHSRISSHLRTSLWMLVEDHMEVQDEILLDGIAEYQPSHIFIHIYSQQGTHMHQISINLF